MTAPEGEMTVKAVPDVGAHVVVILEERGFLPAFSRDFFEGAVLTVSVFGQQVDVTTHTADGAGVVETVVADVEFLALAKVSIVQLDARGVGMNLIIT